MGQILQLKDRLLKQIHALDVYRNYKLRAQIENMLVKPFQHIIKIPFLLQTQVILLGGDLIGIFIDVEHYLVSSDEDFFLQSVFSC